MNNKLTNFSLLAGALLIGVSQANAIPSYTFKDLGNGSASAINNVGQVAGTVYADMFHPHAIVWNGNTATVLLSEYSFGIAINNAGQVAGFSYDAEGLNAIVWNGITPTKLGEGYNGNAINNAGQVAGTNGLDALVWTRTGNGTTVTKLGGAQAAAINDVGQVAGGSSVWTITGDVITVTALGDSAIASAINNAGQVAGTTYSNHGSRNATLWAISGNGVTTTFLGSGYANAINSAGLVVGQSFDGKTAILWNGTTAIDLNSFLTADEISAGWKLTSANGINDSGSIVGDASNFYQTGVPHAFLLSPDASVGAVPEPETYALMLAGLGALGLVARCRKLR